LLVPDKFIVFNVLRLDDANDIISP